MDGEKFTNTSITIKGLLGLIEQRILLFLRFSDLFMEEEPSARPY